MALKNILIVVDDVGKSKEFYHDLFGLIVVKDFGENVILSEGLVLQDRKVWEQLINESAVAGNTAALFFEESDFDAFLRRVEEYRAEVVAKPVENCWGKRVIRIKDLDGHMIEVAER